MGSIVLDLQREAVNSKISVVQLLRKSLLIARKLGLRDFGKWINNELNGYETYEEIPDYRIVTGDIKAFNPFNGIWMPIIYESAEEAKIVSSRKIHQKITELENLAEKKENPHLHVPFPKEYETKLMQKLEIPSKPVLIIQHVAVVGIIESVRNIILEWTMKLEEEGIMGDEIKFSAEEKLNALSNNQINITYFQGVLGNITNSALVQKNKLNVRQNDFESLKEYLSKELSLEKKEIDELQVAITDDAETPNQKGKFGKNVSAWIGKIISKAATGALKISLNTVANILSDAISNYYGF